MRSGALDIPTILWNKEILRVRRSDAPVSTATLALLALAVALAASGCSGDGDAAPAESQTAASVEPSQPEPAPADVQTVLAFSFDGESCEATLPETIDAGEHQVTFNNQTDAGSFTGTGGLREGFTVDEALALASAAQFFNVDDPIPEWLDPARVQFPGLVADPMSVARGTAVFSAGTYLFSCVFPDPADPTSDTGRWITGGAFVVEEAAVQPDA
ncbi:MAG: hypothetical protein ACR2OD_02230 [Gaiellaceae bacterium]